MKKIILIICGIILISSHGYAVSKKSESIDMSDYVEVNAYKDLYPTIVWLHNRSNSNSTTGVLLNLKYNTEKKSLVATNYHLIVDTANIVDIWLFDSNGKPTKYRGEFWAGDKEADIALFEVRVPSLIKVNSQEAKIKGLDLRDGKIYFADTNLSLSDDHIGNGSRLKAGISIRFFGFPLNLGIGDCNNKVDCTLPQQKLPIVRYGRIAYSENDSWFLIDAMNNPGNSGSPIFTLEWKCVNGDCLLHPVLVGIIKGYVYDYIEVTLNNSSVKKIPYNSGLSYAISSKKILECFRNKIKKEDVAK